MNQINLNQNDLQQIVQLLQQAQSHDNTLQKSVFNTLKTLQQHNISYIYLATIFAQQTIPLSIRQLAGLTLNSALKRNSQLISFSQSEVSYIRQAIISQQKEQLQKCKYTLISTLIIMGQFDYYLFLLLINQLTVRPDNILILKYTLEDIRGNSQNNNLFAQSQFKDCIKKLYQQLLNILNNLNKQDLRSNRWMPEYLKCLNLLTFKCPPQLNYFLQNYLQTVIKGILTISQQQQINTEIAFLALEGANQIFATRHGLIVPEWIDFIIGYSSCIGNTTEMQKQWTNIVIQMMESDQNQYFRQKLPLILPKVIKNLNFTQEDQINLKQEMDIEYNPYQEQSTNEDFQGMQDLTNTTFSGDTLRRLSFILARKIAYNYSQELWVRWGKDIINAMHSSNLNQLQTATAFLGIIGQPCFDYLSQQISQIMSLLVQNSSSPDLLIRATSIWTIQKLFPLYDQKQAILVEFVRRIDEEQVSLQSRNTVSLMYQEACISLIDTFFEWQEYHDRFKQSPDLLQTIIKILVRGLNLITGRGLITIFSTIKTLFQIPLPKDNRFISMFNYITQQLNQMWQKNQSRDSVVCPLLQCLITGIQLRPQLFRQYIPAYLRITLPLLTLPHRTSLILRCLDFISSIVNKTEPQPIFCSSQFLQQIMKLLRSDEMQIVHFTFGLIIDLVKKYDLSAFTEGLIPTVAQSINQRKLTSLNNGLSCLTQIIIKGYPASARFIADVMDKILTSLKKERLQPIIAFNLSRLYGRLSLLDPVLSKNKLLEDSRTVKAIFLSLRTMQVVNTTNDAFRGLIRTIAIMSHAQIISIASIMSCVIDCLVCYPIRVDPKPEDKQLIYQFVELVKHINKELGSAEWEKMLQQPIFLPGSLKTINSWLLSP